MITESENCMSSPMMVLKDCSVLGSSVLSGKPNENRSHSAPSRRTPNFVRGVRTRRRSESISSKSLTLLPPRATSPPATYVPSARYSPVSGQNQLSLFSSAKAGVPNKNVAETVRKKCRDEKSFISLPIPTAVAAKQGDSLGNIFHHH